MVGWPVASDGFQSGAGDTRLWSPCEHPCFTWEDLLGMEFQVWWEVARDNNTSANLNHPSQTPPSLWMRKRTSGYIQTPSLGLH